MSRDMFLARLDAAILAGKTTPKVAQSLGIGEMSVRKRKRALREMGLLPYDKSSGQWKAEVPQCKLQPPITR